MNKLNMMNIMNKTKELKKRVAVVLAASMVLVQGVPVSATEPVLPDESAEQAPAYIFWDDLDENESVRTVPIDSLDDADENVPRDGGGNDYTRYISYYYNDIHGKLTQETLSASGVSHLQQSSTSWGKNGNLFYQVTNELFIPDRVEISANEAVNLILTDNSKLICGQGIHLGPGATLTIFAQSEGENRGKLTISGNGGAGIGGNPGEGGGTVYIHGGKVTISSNGGAGIGGGNGTANQAGGDGGDVTIFGGSVNIHDVDAAGIGGGNGGAGAAGGNVRIHGGEVTIDNPKAAGIGGGNGGNGGNGNGGDGAVGGAGATVLITGGNLSINKTQNTKAAGIGGGNGGAGTNGGDGGDGGWFGVKGGKVTVTVNDPNNGNVGIGGGPGGETANNTGGNPGAGGIGSSITVSGGSVSAGSIGSEAGGGSITLGWTDISDSFYAGRYYGNIDFKLQNNKDFWYKTGKTSYTDVEVDENRQVTNINNLEGQTLYQKGSFGIKVLYENGTANGSVSVQERAFPNETVRITSNPKPGHSVCKFCVFDADDGQLPLSGYGTDFSFTMPASDVATSKLLFVPLVIVKQPEDLTLTEGYPDGYEVTILAKASNGGDCYCTWWSNNTGKNSEGEMLTDTTVSGCRIPRGYPAGTTKYYYCEVNQLTSGKIVSRVAKVTVVPKPHTHVFTPAVTTPATLFSEGLMTYTCSCGETYTETIPKLVPSSEEEAADVTQLLEDLTGTDGNLKADIDVNTKTDEDGTTVTTVTIGDQEVIKITTDEDGDETVESSIWTIGGEDEDFTYTGAAVKPVIHVYDGIHKLSEGSEYAVKYGNNVNAGEKAWIYVSFGGSYKGTPAKTVYFTIKPADLTKDAAAENLIVASSKKLQAPIPTITLSNGTVINKQLAYRYLDSEGNVVKGVNDPGSYTLEAKAGKNNNNFINTLSANITVTGEKVTPLSQARVLFSQKQYIYTGKPVTPGYTLYMGKEKLTEGSDFTVKSVTNNTKPGKARITFAAVDGNEKGLVGTKSAEFVISNGRVLTPQGEGSDFTYTIAASTPYAKGGAKPFVTVKDGDYTLVYNKDYTVGYDKNSKKITDKATAVVKGMGNYKGSVPVTFAVVKQDIAALSANIIVDDKAESKKGYENPVVTVTDLDGNRLKAGADFTVSDYSAPDENGIVKATLNGKGCYEGSTEISYRYIELSKHLLKIKATAITPKTYTGRQIKLTKNELNKLFYTVDKKANKINYLEPGKDFEVVGYSNNTKAGAATVTVRGLGEYGGVRTFKFKINNARRSLINILLGK